MDQSAGRYREAALETVQGLSGPDVPLLLSGGMDSMTLLAARLALGEKPECVSYRLRGSYKSEDLLAAEVVCEMYGLHHEVVVVPSDDEALVELTRRCIALAGNTRKTSVQCLYALVPMMDFIREAGLTRAMIGTGGVSEDNRRSKILAADYERNREELEALRRGNLLEGDPENATETMKRAASDLGVELVEPFATNPLAETALSIPYPEINRPVLKGIACRAFPEFFVPEDGGFRWWRVNTSLQVNGGVRDLHERLLSLPVNRRGSKAVVGVYNDLAQEEAHGEQLGLI